MSTQRIEITYFKTVDGLINITAIKGMTAVELQEKYGDEVLRAYRNYGTYCANWPDHGYLNLYKEVTLAVRDNGGVRPINEFPGNHTVTRKGWQISTGTVTKETFTKIIHALEEAGNNLSAVITGTRIAMEKTKTITI
jgi:hypothetical protein